MKTSDWIGGKAPVTRLSRPHWPGCALGTCLMGSERGETPARVLRVAKS